MATDISGLRQQVKQSEFKGHPVLKLVAHRVASVRRKKGLTKKTLMKLANVNQRTLDAIEKGNNYTIYNLLSVMNALKISSLHKKKKQKETNDDFDLHQPSPSGAPSS